ncbi:MAG: UDP-N-acetylglucosamine--N-acetylmuramyl-(pentapeptide) pyrophosphoryl-undecaprenol N-acetylglucosamine transferase [Patescibacteria group bacterium]|nr:UDP-N-acetylglucosamine--N-acetylmuramyl-(pentapeptide) pyrophosphoryl-undecaprenol N-acetylglucosamine transferase [Patescibacteria group bacterium]MDW8279980.1 UDP-N-acetylglucosamine--N-acetylmuramyl-(pentapeptide) pyrophosphoryl-undecaprenol N-acetylglucosamine transferase [bacterium]
MRKDLRILLTGGGSGGHIFPLISVYEELKKISDENNLNFEFIYMGPKDNWSQMLDSKNIKLVYILGGKIRRYFSLLNFLDFFKILFSFAQAIFKMFFIMPDVIFSKGGPGALPVVFAGWFYKIPVLIHESDAYPGLVNLLSVRFAKKIAVAFEQAKKYFPSFKTIVVGNPIRSKILSFKIDQKIAKEKLGFNANLPLILVIGGSQGAQRINELILLGLKDLLRLTQIFHQTGELNFLEVQKMARAIFLESSLNLEINYRITPFLDEENLNLAYNAADLIISRAGSGSIFEIAAFGKPSIIIPLSESANDHQRKNAYAYSENGAAVIIEEENLIFQIFIDQIKLILTNKEKYQKMSEAAQKFAKQNSSQLIAEELFKLI